MGSEDFENGLRYDLDEDGDYDADDQAIEEILLRAGWEGRDGSPVKERLEREKEAAARGLSDRGESQRAKRGFSQSRWVMILFLIVTIVLFVVLTIILRGM